MSDFPSDAYNDPNTGDDEANMAEVVLPVIVLAAGAGRRMKKGPAGGKLAINVEGNTVLGWTMRLLASQSSHNHLRLRVIVVLSPGSSLIDHVDASAASLSQHENCSFEYIVAPQASRGMAWSLHAGIHAALPRHGGCPPGVFIVPADDPIAVLALNDVAKQVQYDPTQSVIVERDPVGTPHPVWIPMEAAHRFVPPEKGPGADRGLRGLLHNPASVLTTAPAPIDVDRPDDVAKLATLIDQLGYGHKRQRIKFDSAD
ncbi:MAG: NTP transferase domain-containing protein [Thermoleophilia bacterium]|nr:NTP transferase domain-containing protein [Thermoleophilia bacterium]